MAFIVDDTIVYSHLVLLGAVAYFCGHFGLQIVLSLKGSPCPDHYMQMHIRTPANTLKNHVALLRLIPMVAVSSPRSEKLAESLNCCKLGFNSAFGQG
jgi:multisubunit Na+/H+ antiporter MnhG subunit